MYDITFGLSGTVWIAIAIIAGVLGWGFINMGFSAGTKKLLKVVCVAGVLIGSVALGFWATSDDTVTTGTVVDTTISWDTVITSADSYVDITGDNSALVTFNCSGSAVGNDGTFNITFTSGRTDTNPAEAVTKAYFVDYGEVTNTTSAVTYNGVEKETGGAWNTNFTDGSVVTINQCIFPADAETRSDSILMSVTVNPLAMYALEAFGSYNIVVSCGGENFTFTVMRIASA